MVQRYVLRTLSLFEFERVAVEYAESVIKSGSEAALVLVEASEHQPIAERIALAHVHLCQSIDHVTTIEQ